MSPLRSEMNCLKIANLNLIGILYTQTQFSVVHVVHDAPEKPDQPYGRVYPHPEVWPKLDDFLQHKDTQMEFVLNLIADDQGRK